MGIIDAWTHLIPPNYFNKLSELNNQSVQEAITRIRPVQIRNPHFMDIQKRIEDLDKNSIDSQVAMINPDVDPNCLMLSHREELDLSKCQNDELGRVMDSSRGRIFAVGTIPMRSMSDVCAEEMRRAIQDLGLKGFMVMSNLRGKPVDEFDGIWAEAERLGVPIYIHPVDPINSSSRPYEQQYDLAHIFGWPFETSLILARLVCSGALERYPKLNVIAHHLGGMVPFVSGRIEESYDSKANRSRYAAEKDSIRGKLSKPIWEYFKQFYYDTAVGGTSTTMRCGYETFGAKRIVFSTDYPWGPEGGKIRLSTYPKMIRQMNFTANEENDIFEGNIRRLLKI